MPVEFKNRAEIKNNPVTCMCGYGTHNQSAGTWSDDTSLTLALIDSIVQKRGLDYADIMGRFCEWYMYGEYTARGEVFDVGNSTSSSIMNYGHGINPLECGGSAEYENGNGSLMRILPIAYYLSAIIDRTLDGMMNVVHNVSSLTHRHPISLIGCGIYVNIAVKMLTSDLSLYSCIEQGVKEAFEYYECEMPDYIGKYVRIEDILEFSNISEYDIQSSGYIVDTLEAALWCLIKTASYEECVLKAVNLGEDTDTVGAVAGGLAGIYYGAETIPKKWLDVIAKKQYIEELCEDFQRMLENQS